MLYSQRYETLRRLLRNARLQAALKQKELAQKLGREQAYISKVERGAQYIDTLEFIEWCEACNVSPNDIIARI